MGLDLYNGYTPYTSQKKMLEATERFVIYAGNRGPGKTTAGCWKIMDLCLDFPGVYGFIGRWHKTKLFSTTLKCWKDCFPEKEFIDGQVVPSGWSTIFEYTGGSSEEPDYIKFKNGSLINLLPLQHYADNLRGPSYCFGLIDQGEESGNQDVWNAAVRAVRAPIFSYQDGERVDVGAQRRFLIATINKSRGWHSFKRKFKDKKGLAPDEVGNYLLIENAWDENERLVREGYYRDMTANSKNHAEYLFEVMGVDPEEFGLVFPMFDRADHVMKFEFSEDRFKDASFMLGYDDGYDVPAAFLFMAVTPDGKHWVRAEHHEARMTISQHQQKLHEIANRIGFPLKPHYARFVCDRAILGNRDRTSGMSIAEQWGREWPWVPASKNRVQGWTRLRSLLEKDQSGNVNLVFHEDDCPKTIEEFEEAFYDEEKEGKLLSRCSDHSLDCARYCSQASLTPFEAQPAPDITGTWLQFRQAQEKGGSWLMPSEDKAPVLVPRKSSSPRLPQFRLDLH